MLTRARSLQGLLILRLPKREDLTRGAPKHLVAEVNRLLRLEKSSTAALKRRLAVLEGVLPAAVITTLTGLFRHDTIESEVHDAHITGNDGGVPVRSMTTAAQRLEAPASAT